MGTELDNRHLGLAAPAALLVAAALIVGCGGGGSTESSTTVDLPTGELTKSELATEADALCADATDRIMNDADRPDFGEDGPQPDEVEASAPFWSATAAEGQALVDQLSELQPPKDLQKQWDEFLQLLEAGTVDYANALLAPAEDADPDAFYSAALGAQKDLKKLAESSAALGMQVCGSSDVPSS